MRDMSVQLSRRGHDVTVITSRLDRSDPAAETAEGVKIIRVPLLATILRTPIPRGLSKHLDLGQFDLVHSHTPPPSFAYLLAKKVKRSGRPSVVTYHCDSDLPSRIISPVVRTIDIFVTRRIINNSTRVLVTTRTYSSTSSNTWKITPEIVPVSADTTRFHPDAADRAATRKKFDIGEGKVVLFVGRLVRHKGVQFLIDAMRNLDPDTHLLVAGDGEYAGRLRRLVTLFGLSNRVRLLGDVPDNMLPSLYRAADVAVVPSTSRLEAFSIAAIESMASGTPVLVSNIPGVREVIEDGVTGMRSEPMNPADIAGKLRELLSDEERLRKMGESGVRRAATFSSSAVAETLTGIYSGMLESGKPQGDG